MKKAIMILIVLSICSIVCVSAVSEDKFVEALRNCSPYNDAGNININGVDTTSVKQMQGWRDGRCVYKETLKYSGVDISTVCRFSRSQIDEIVSVADAYYTTLNYTHETPDLSSTDAIKNNPIAQVLSKYLQDPSVCSITAPQ